MKIDEMKLSEKFLADLFEQYQKEKNSAKYNLLQKTYYPDMDKDFFSQGDIKTFRLVQIGIERGITNFAEFRSIVELVFSDIISQFSSYCEKNESKEAQKSQKPQQQPTTTQSNWTEDGVSEEKQDKRDEENS